VYVLESNSSWRLLSSVKTQIVEKRDLRAWLLITLISPNPAYLYLTRDGSAISGLSLIGEGSSVTFNRLNPWIDGIWANRSAAVNSAVAWTEVYWRKV